MPPFLRLPMYVMMFYKRNDDGCTTQYWEIFEDLQAMQLVYETLKKRIVGSILTFETNSAFIMNQ